MKQIICPISTERINERVTRLNALFAIFVTAIAFVLKSEALLIFLSADFFIRAFTKIKYSPISYASSGLVQALQLSGKKIDKAPKIFAARLGFVMSFFISVFFLLDYQIAASVIAGVLVFFAALEFVFAFCAGCVMYTYLVLPFFKK